MKKNNNILFKIILVLLIFIVGVEGTVRGSTVVPERIIIKTEDYAIDRVLYRNLEIQAKKIVSDVGLGYCLEIDKNYPAGESFKLQGEAEESLNKILAAGYPNRSVSELGVHTADEAYFATQIAIWCLLEGYNVNEIQGNNTNIVMAIKQIYNNGINDSKQIVTKNTKIYYANESIQEILVVLSKVDIRQYDLVENQEEENEIESIESKNEIKKGK